MILQRMLILDIPVNIQQWHQVLHQEFQTSVIPSCDPSGELSKRPTKNKHINI